MNGAIILVVTCAVTCPMATSAQAADTVRTQINDVRKSSPPAIVRPRRDFILRQDLVDPNNPNNLRSDWPRPSGLPGPGH